MKKKGGYKLKGEVLLFGFFFSGRFGPKKTASIWGCKAFLGCTGCMHWLHRFSGINSSVEGILLFGRLVKIPALMILTVVLTITRVLQEVIDQVCKLHGDWEGAGWRLGEGNVFFSADWQVKHTHVNWIFLASTVFAGPGRNAAGKIAQDCAKNHCTRLPERHKECWDSLLCHLLSTGSLGLWFQGSLVWENAAIHSTMILLFEALDTCFFFRMIWFPRFVFW